MSSFELNEQTNTKTPKPASQKELLITWILMAAFAAGAIMLSLKVQKLEAQLAHTPPVVVVDFVKLVDSYGEDLEPAALEQRMLQTGDKIQKLRQAGYLVLDAANVIASPESLNLPLDVIKDD